MSMYRQRPKVVQDPDTHELVALLTGMMHLVDADRSTCSSGGAMVWELEGNGDAVGLGISGKRNGDFSWTMGVPVGH